MTRSGDEQESWRHPLRGKAFTHLPRWTAPDGARHGEESHRTALPIELLSALRAVAAESAVDLESVLLGASLKVLSVIAAERDVLAGYAAADASALPCRFVFGAGSWRELVIRAHAARHGILRHREQFETAVRDAAEPLFEAVVQPAGPEHPMADGAVLHVRYALGDGGAELVLRYRTEAVNQDYARRLAGYHVAALRAIAERPDEEHEPHGLLSDDELRYQLDELSGPVRPLPEKCFVELFEQRVRRHPDRLAAIHRDRRWTYRELNERANQVAHALLARGVQGEDVVAVVAERNLEWMSATLGVLKAGGAYLPVRPDFPADRINAQLRLSDCRLVLSEPGGSGTLDAAVAGLGRDCTVLSLNDLTGGDRSDPGVPIAADQLAYIYFTSGSTGAPKGAMCEHAGMLNHLYAKVDDLAFGAGETVCQTASQCFDISLWQLIAPLLVGGSTLIVDTETQLDVGRFLAELAENRVRVAQLVPSYLEVLLSYVEAHRVGAGALRAVSVTGEVLKLDLVRRWFASFPGIRLVNAYGATEVSDDTMHEVLEGLPERPFVTVGRSLRNVHTYVLDEHQRLAPLGSPGEVVFSGVAVGRGYINDEERTRQVFRPDPYRPGTRMYRMGDYGRWLPEGRIEFLGRKDEQVKIRGYRIEIGEIENKLLAQDGVRDAAVVVDTGTQQDKALVAFYSGPDTVRPDALREALSALLPEYMVPASAHRLDVLPLNENGKVDKKVLTRLAGTLGYTGAGYVEPRTGTERRLATAWAEVLNLPPQRIGRDDDFFGLGGSSLAAVRLVVKLDGAVSLSTLVQHSSLRALAAALDAARAAPTPTGAAFLQPLSSTSPGTLATLVCFPYAGGNAVNFHLLAKELEPHGVAVQAVELPGHDLTDGGSLSEVREVAAAVSAEIQRDVEHPVLLWGHCAGAAFALEVARLLESRGRAVPAVFVAALLLEEIGQLRRESDQVAAMGDKEITALLREDSAYVELDGLKPERSAVVGAAYRHDVRSTNRYFTAVREDPAAHRIRAAIDVVVATDDPATPHYSGRYADWGHLSDRVHLHEIEGGGHYFARTRAGEAASIVLAGCAGIIGAGERPR